MSFKLKNAVRKQNRVKRKALKLNFVVEVQPDTISEYEVIFPKEEVFGVPPNVMYTPVSPVGVHIQIVNVTETKIDLMINSELKEHASAIINFKINHKEEEETY